MNRLTDQDVAVIGVSGDSVLNHHLFKKAWKLNFTLLADEAGEVAAKFGVPAQPGGKVVPRGPDRKILMDENGKQIRLERKATFARWTFIIGKNGKILYKNTKVHPVNDSQQVLGFIEKLKKESKSAL
jgi:peroxiredoxin Q/BCP